MNVPHVAPPGQVINAADITADIPASVTRSGVTYKSTPANVQRIVTPALSEDESTTWVVIDTACQYKDTVSALQEDDALRILNSAAGSFHPNFGYRALNTVRALTQSDQAERYTGRPSGGYDEPKWLTASSFVVCETAGAVK